MSWKQDLFCCHKDIKICLITWCVPCFTYGKIYEKLGDSCIKCGLVSCIPCANVWFMAKAREQIRTKKNIEGTFPKDCLLSCCCGGCVLCQAAKELNALDKLNVDPQRDLERA